MSQNKDTIGADKFLEVLGNWDTEYIFGCPGTTEVAILDAMVGRDKPSFILVPQEGVAVSAADGYARITGKPGVVQLHANVGLANGVSQVYTAQVAGMPLVVLNAVKHRSILSHGAFTVAHDHQEMVKQYTKWDWMSLRGEELSQDLNKAFQTACQPPMGPVYLALPQDILEEAAPDKGVYPETINRGKNYTRPTADRIKDAARVLAGCKFPLILSGAGAAVENCLEEVKDLAEMIGAGVCCENRLTLDYNAYPTSDNHFLGPYIPNHPVISQVDVILAIGTKLFVEFQPPVVPWIPNNVTLIHIHDDPNEIGKIYPPKVGLCGSVKATLNDLIEELSNCISSDKKDVIVERNFMVAQMHTERNNRLKTQLQETDESGPISVVRLVQAISKFMDEDVTVIADAVTSNDPLVEYLPRPNVYSYYGGATGGSLGWGMGAAIGAKLGAPERKIISVVGDGVFMFGMPALWTAQKYRVPIVYIVINNGHYAAVKAGLIRYGKKAVNNGVFPATDISGVNYAEVAQGFGIASERVDNQAVLEKVLEKALLSEEPFLLEVLTNPNDVGKLAR